jgi:hypothetical protein
MYYQRVGRCLDFAAWQAFCPKVTRPATLRNYFPPSSNLAIVCSCMLDVPS